MTATGGRILIVDDDTEFADAIGAIIAGAGHCPEIVHDGHSAIERATSTPFDLILLDLGLPDLDGVAICRTIRDSGVNTPILVVSGDSEASQKVKALTSGADDFVVKPFVVDELLARISALLRRYRASRQRLSTYRNGSIHVDFLGSTVTRSDTRINFSAKEIQLLRFLIERKNCVVSRETLLKHVWGYVSTDTRTIDVHVATVRQKLEDNPQQPRLIVTVRGKGYMFCD